MQEHAPPPDDLESLATDLMPDTHNFSLLHHSPKCPFRPIDWRWIVAAFLVRTSSRTRLRWIDAPIRRAAHYIRWATRPTTSGRSKRSSMDPSIVGAVALRSGPSNPVRTAIEGLLLAGVDDHTIAARVGLDPGVVAAYHDVFFEVRPLLEHSDALLARVFGEKLYTLPRFYLRRVGTAHRDFAGGRCPPYEYNFWEAYYTEAPDAEQAVKLQSFFGGQLVAEALVAAVVLPSASDAPGDDHGKLVEQFEDFLLVSSLPEDSRSLPTLLGLLAQASQLALDSEDSTVASVSKSLSIGDLDVRMLVELGDPVRAADPIGPFTGSPGRAEGTPGGVGEVDVTALWGLAEGGVRLGIAG